jgi:regulatory protein
MSWTKVPKQDLSEEPSLVYAAVLRYLSRREYTAAELRKQLEERGAAVNAIDAALSYAQEHGYQDDARAGEALIRQRLNYSPRGRAFVRQELKERGLSFELSMALLDRYYPPETERVLLQRLLSKETQLEQTQPRAKPLLLEDAQKAWRLRQKLARRLLAKGFCRSLVMEVLEELLPQKDDGFFME